MKFTNRNSKKHLNFYTNTWNTGGYIKMVDLASARIRYLDIGNGKPVLLIHTLRTQLDYFQKAIPLLKNHYRIIALDLPGHGYSSIPSGADFDEPFFRKTIIEFIEKLDLQELMIAGESIGGVLALTVAACLPDRVIRVISINPYDYGEKFGGGIRRSRFGFIIALFKLFRSWTYEASFLLRLVLNGGFIKPAELTEDLFREFVHSGNRRGYRRAEYLLYKHWRSWLYARALYQKIKSSITLAYGEKDWSFSNEREANKSILAPEQYIMLANAAHFSALETPEGFIKVILTTT
jgi:pimeloyl-ACP methyl ester carboxylesterase